MGREVLIFERRHMIGILLFVFEKGGCTRMELYNGLANNDRMPDKLALLEEHGLLVQLPVPVTRAIRIELTEKGKDAVGHFLAIDRIISE